MKASCQTVESLWPSEATKPRKLNWRRAEPAGATLYTADIISGVMLHWPSRRAARTTSEALSKEEFRKALQDLWPVASGSLSLRKSPCVREHCQACLKNEGHRSYVLYGKTGNKRFSLYIPVRLVPEVQTAIRNGRRLQELISAAGVTYVNGLKQQKVEENV